MKITERTLDEAYVEFVRLSKLSVFRKWIYWFFWKLTFPICVRVDDSRQYSGDLDDDYLITKHFLDIEQQEDALVIKYFITRDPQGKLNESSNDLEFSEDDKYCWPVISSMHTKSMILKFIHFINT